MILENFIELPLVDARYKISNNFINLIFLLVEYFECFMNPSIVVNKNH
jgi:hypothetical protein